MKKLTWIEIITYAFIILFMYTALTKILAFDTNLFDLRRSPFLGPYATMLAIGIPAIEILISILLFLPGTRQVGLIAATLLMFIFTMYVWILLKTQSSLPCTCGGIIRDLTWRQHLYFNIFFMLLGAIGIWLNRTKLQVRSNARKINYT